MSRTRQCQWSVLWSWAFLFAVAIASATPVLLTIAQTAGPREVFLLDMPILAQCDTRQLPLLASGAVALPTACQTCSVAATQYCMWIPDGIVRLVLEIASDGGAILCLAARNGVPVLEDAEYVYFNYSSCELPTPLRLEIYPEGGSRLTPGACYIAILGIGGETHLAFELRGALYASELPLGVSMEISRAVMLSQEKYTHSSGRFSLSYPLGWEAVRIADLHPNVMAAFASTSAAGNGSEALLEIGGWAMTVPRTAAEVLERLKPAYTEAGLFQLTGDVQEAVLDEMPAVIALFTGSPMTTLLGCATEGLDVWLITMTFKPLTDFPLYEAAFRMAFESFHRER